MFSTLAACAADAGYAPEDGAESASELSVTPRIVKTTPAVTVPLTIYRPYSNMWFAEAKDEQGFGGFGLQFGGGAGTPVRVRQTVNGKSQDVFGWFNAGSWTIDANGDQIQGSDDATGVFGIAGDVPVSGNWSTSGIGVFRQGVWYFDKNGNGYWDAGDTTTNFGSAGDIPVVGDWNGDGHSKIGVFNNGAWYLDWNGDGVWGAGDIYRSFGTAGDTPVVAPWTGGTADQIGVFNGRRRDTFAVQTRTWTLDTNANGVMDPDDARKVYGPGVEDVDTPVAVLGNWKSSGTSTVMQCGGGMWPGGTIPSDCGAYGNRVLRQPLELKMRNSSADPTSFAVTAFETEYLTSVGFTCTSNCPPRSLVAGSNAVAITPSAGHTVRVQGIGPLQVGGVTAPVTNPWGWTDSAETNSETTQLLVKTWYAAPSDYTLDRWADMATAQAKALTDAQSFYTLANQYASQVTYTHDQLDGLAKVAQQRADSATNPIDKKKWQALATSLAQTRDAQPTPVPASQLAQYLADLVSNARADMLLQGARTQDMLAMFDRVQAELEAVAASTSSEIGRLRDVRTKSVSTKMTQPIAGLKAALARTPV